MALPLLLPGPGLCLVLLGIKWLINKTQQHHGDYISDRSARYMLPLGSDSGRLYHSYSGLL